MLTLKYIIRLMKERFPVTDDCGFLKQDGGNDPLGMHGRANSQLPDLLTMLHDEYRNYLAQQLEILKTNGSKAKFTSAADAADAAPTKSFLNFAKKYLLKNRPTQQFPVDDNVGIVLRNHVRCCIAPGHNKPGSMQSAGAIHVTHGESQPELGGTSSSDSVGI